MVAKVIIRALDIHEDTGSYPRLLAASVDFRKYAIMSTLDQRKRWCTVKFEVILPCDSDKYEGSFGQENHTKLHIVSCGNTVSRLFIISYIFSKFSHQRAM